MNKDIILICLSVFMVVMLVISCNKEDSDTDEPLLYQCINNNCIQTYDGTYPTQSECNTACANPNGNNPGGNNPGGNNPTDTTNNNPTIIVDVQAGLNDGYTPFELIDYGFPVSDLYGKWYQGGEIFHIDRAKGKGLVHSVAPISYNYDSTRFKCETQIALSDAVFDGATNTSTIVSLCPDLEPFVTAANLSLNYYDFNTYSDWYVPNEGELDILVNNRTFDQTHAYYYLNYVWSSSVSDEDNTGNPPFWVTIYSIPNKDLFDNEERATDPFHQGPNFTGMPDWNQQLIVVRQFSE